MTTTSRATEFFVNGHQCLIRNKGREHWIGLVNGEQIVSSHSTSNIRDELITQAKHQVEVEPDYWKVCRAVHNFLKAQKSRDGEYVWVYNKTAINAVTPLEDVGIAYNALLELESLGVVEKSKVAMRLNHEEMFRAVSDADADYPDENPWKKYES